MICPNCQKEVPDTSKACGYCGQWLKSPPPQKAKIPAWLWPTIAIAALLVAISALVYLFLNRNPAPAPVADVAATVAAAVAATRQAEETSPLVPPTPAPAITAESQPPPDSNPEKPETGDTLAPTVTPKNAVPAKLAAEVTAYGTSIRQAPDLSARSVMFLAPGKQVELLAVNPERTWVKGQVYEEVGIATGWLLLEHLKLNISLDELPVETGS